MMSMHVSDLDFGPPLQLRLGSQTILMLARGTDPDGNGCAPKAIARHGPVLRLRQPVGKALVPNGLGHPANAAVVAQHALPQLGDLNQPHGNGLVDQGGAATPAIGVAVLNRLVAKQQPPPLKRTDDVWIGFFNPLPCKVRHCLGELALFVHGIHQLNVRAATHFPVVLPISRCHVDNACAGVGGHMVRRENGKALGFLRFFLLRKVRKGWLIALAHQISSHTTRHNGDGIPKAILNARFRNNVKLVVRRAAHNNILYVGVHSYGQISRQSPGRSGPHQQVDWQAGFLLLVVFAFHLMVLSRAKNLPTL